MPARSRSESLWSILVIGIAAIAAYSNSLHGPFVFDDASSIVTNPTIRRLDAVGEILRGPVTNVTAQGRPMLNLSLALNYAVGGTAVKGYHVGNLLIHLLAGLTLFGLVRRMWMLRPVFSGTAPRAGTAPAWVVALAVAVLWTVHPLQTESVTYIIQRAESLVGLFYLLTLYCFVRGVESSPSSPARESRDVRDHEGEMVPPPPRRATGWFALSVIACLLGMATKEVMATAPLMVLLLDRTFFAGTFRNAWRQRRGFYGAVAGTWLLLAWLVAQTGGNRGGSVGFGVGVSWADYWLTQFQAVGRYLVLACWPHPLAFEYGAFWIHDFSEIAIQVVVVFGLLGATGYGLWRRSALGFLGAWFFGILAPTSLAPGTTQMIVEHRMYLPLAAVIVVMVAGAQAWWVTAKRMSLVALLGSAAIAFVLLTVARNRDYRSEIALWTDTVAKRPNNPLAHFMLAGAQERAGNLAGALASYEQTLELKPDFSIGHEQFGELLMRQGRRGEAITHFEAALRLQPQYADAHANIGTAYLADGRITEAIGHLERATQLAPGVALTHCNLGNALAASGLAVDAMAEFEAALRLQPTQPEAHYNLANALSEAGRSAEAVAHFEAALKQRPDFAPAHYNLANALVAAGRHEDAIGHYEAALQARPGYPEAHHNLGSALFELGRFADAAKQYEETLRLAPDFPNAREHLAAVRAKMAGR